MMDDGVNEEVRDGGGGRSWSVYWRLSTSSVVTF